MDALTVGDLDHIEQRIDEISDTLDICSERDGDVVGNLWNRGQP